MQVFENFINTINNYIWSTALIVVLVGVGLYFTIMTKGIQFRCFKDMFKNLKEKDLDGISPVNQAKLYAGDKSGFAPCTAEAVMRILSYYKVDPRGKKAVVVGRSTVIGRPAAMLLLAANATVTITHTKTADLAAECRQADILVAAAGHAGTVRADFIKPGAVVLDVGINVDENGKLCGDVDAQAVRDEGKASALTPVPRGVGSVTTSVLAEHLLRAAEARRETK